MRIPLNWLSEFVKLPENTRNLTNKLTLAGHMLNKVDVVEGNKVIDLELRSNRADCYSILGIAQEVSALFETPIKYPKASFKIKKIKELPEVKLIVKTSLVKRVMMVIIKDVKIEKSPDWLARRLKEYGVAPINNIVDLTNYVMIETGEPMHAFDLDKVGDRLEIRLSKTNEKMATFQGSTLTLSNEDLVWTNKDTILSVAGAIGGKSHSISPSTKNVLLEAASYNRANIRRSIHRHNLFTDAGIRHEKELDPNIVFSAINRFADLVEVNGWGKVLPYISDYYPKPLKPWKLTLNFDYLHKLSGVAIPPRKIRDILESLNFEILSYNTKKVIVKVPTYRRDVLLEEDLIEEVIRIYGYQHIPIETLSLEIPKVITPPYINQEEKLKNHMAALGFNEVISSSFVSKNYLSYNNVFGVEKYSPVIVQNPPSADIQTLRTTLFPNLLEFSQKILDERGAEASLFEVGKVYLKKGADYIEKRKLGIVYCNKDNLRFSNFKGYLSALFEKINIKGVKFEISDYVPIYLSNSYKIALGKDVFGYGGQKGDTLYAEIDLDTILGKERREKAKLWPSYPPQIEDLTFNIPPRTKIGEIIETIMALEKLISDVELRDIYKDAYTFRIWYQDPTKTLRDDEVEKIRNKILSELKEKFGSIS